MAKGRPRKVVRPVPKNLHFPQDIVARVDLELFSPLEGRVPQGAWAKLLTELLVDWLSKRTPDGTQGPS